MGKRIWRYPVHCPPVALEVISKQVLGESLTWSQDVGLIGDRFPGRTVGGGCWGLG